MSILPTLANPKVTLCFIVYSFMSCQISIILFLCNSQRQENYQLTLKKVQMAQLGKNREIDAQVKS